MKKVYEVLVIVVKCVVCKEELIKFEREMGA